jgi:hypothetical protein
MVQIDFNSAASYDIRFETVGEPGRLLDFETLRKGRRKVGLLKKDLPTF